MSLKTDVNHARKWGRRRSARTSATVAITALVASGLAVVATPQAATAAPAMSCINTLYLTNSADQSVRAMTLTTTGGTTTGTVSGTPAFTIPSNVGLNANQLGIAANGTDAYYGTGSAGATSSIVDYNAAAGATTAHPKPSGVANGTVGAVNPKTGLYYYGAYTGSTLNLYVYNPETQIAQPGIVAAVNAPNAPGGNGDIAFDKAGRLYLVNASTASGSPATSTYRLYVADGTIPTSGTGTAMTSVELTTGTTQSAANGIAFASDGHLYVGGSTSIQKANPITGASIGAPITLPAGVTSTDLGTCANPSTAEVVSAFPNGKDQPTDSTTITVGGGSYGTPGTAPDFPASSPNPDGSTSTEPGVVLPGETYTVTQTGNGTTNLGNYTTTWACRDQDGRVISQGTGNTATYTAPTGTDGSSTVCTFSNQLPPPVAVADTATVTFGTTPIVLAGATNDTPGNGVILPAQTVFTSASATNGGKTLTTTEGVWTIGTDGRITFTPAQGYSGTTTPVGYRITDDNGLTSDSTATVTVRPGPTAVADTNATTQGVAVDVSPLSNDTAGQNADGTAGTIAPSTLQFPTTGQPSGATVTNSGRTLTVPNEGQYVINATTGVVTFTPAATFFGTAQPVAYTFTDNNGNAAGSTITITVTEVKPTATPDTANTPYGTAISVDVLANDTAGPGGALVPGSVVLTDPAATNGGKRLETADGVWTVGTDGRITFTPNAGYSGTTPAVTYQVTDANGQTATSTVGVTVRPGPTAVADTNTTTQGVAVDVSPLSNDTAGQNANGTAGTIAPSTLQFPTTGQPAGATVTNSGRTLTVPNEGQYVINATTGVTTFTPAATFFGTAQPVAYTFADNNGNAAGSTITITVTEVKPSATPDTANTPYGTAVTVDVLANDTAGPGGALDPTLTVFTDPAATDGGKTLTTPEGTWTIGTDGQVTFTPADGYSGTTPPVTYQVTDANGQTATATVAVTVRPGPSATADSTSTDQNVDVTFPILRNDTPGLRADGTAGTFDPESVRFVVTPALPTGSTVSANGRELTVPGQGVYTFDPSTGQVTFDPAAQFTGTAAPVTYEVDDQAGNTASATITVTVRPITPIVIGDAVKTPGTTPIEFDPLANDAPGSPSAPLDPASVVFTDPAATDGGKTLVTPDGTWTIDGSGTIRFEPTPGFEGTAGPVEYEVRDTNGTPATGQVNVVVGRGALAAPDGGTTKQGQQVTVPLLANDAASDLGNPCEPGETDVPDGCDSGTLTPGSVVFPTAGQPDGADIRDGGRTIEVPGQGVYTIDPATGAVTFTPVPGFTGTAAPIAYSVTDSNGATVSSTVTITVSAVIPVAVDDSASTVFDTPVTVDLLDNDTAGDPLVPLVPGLTVFSATGQPAGVTVSPDGRTLTIPGQGTFVLDAEGNAVFTPVAGYSGTTTAVTYRIEDANGTQREAVVQVTVRPGPVATADGDTTKQGIAVTVSPLGNDTPSRNADDSDGEWDDASVVFPVDGQPAGAVVSDAGKTLTVPGQGAYTVAANGDVTFQPEPTFSGTATPITYAVTDENGNTASSTITIVVTAVTPTATDDAATTAYGTPVTFDIVGNDDAGDTAVPLVVDSAVFEASGIPDGLDAEIRDAGKTLEIAGQGTFTLNDDGTVTFTPADGFSGATTPVRYTISDANGTTATAALVVTVQPGPALENDVDRTPQNTPVTVDVLANDLAGLDADGERGTLDPTSVVFPVDAQSVGTVSDGGKTLTVPGQGVYRIDPATGAITFTPEKQFRGGATPVVYAAADSLGNTATATLTITVQGLDPVARDNAATTPQGTAVTIDVLANDSGATGVPLDPGTLKLVDGDGNLVDSLTVPGEGTWTVVDGKLVFTPLPGFTGRTTPVTYSIADVNGSRATAEVVVTVGALPATGGDVPWIPIGGGILLLLAGLALLIIRRRRQAQ
ncbi:Ig-like domain-containing protein [Microbacterium sp. NPDC089695]|uniref:Ig-like domain-containing protein n=1 Tax=Microbacterium sp. NPDC089695 TaxID=3364198 RepID=UPI00380097D9